MIALLICDIILASIYRIAFQVR